MNSVSRPAYQRAKGIDKMRGNKNGKKLGGGGVCLIFGKSSLSVGKDLSSLGPTGIKNLPEGKRKKS